MEIIGLFLAILFGAFVVLVAIKKLDEYFSKWGW